MHRPPAERDADDRDLDEQGVAVVGRPEIGERRQAGDREIGAGEHEHRDEDGRDPGEAEECAPPQRRRERPDARRQGDEAADPEDRGDEVQPVGEPGEERRVRLDALVPRQRQAGGEAEPDQERRPEEPRPVEDPREQDEGRHDRVAQGHRDERDPEARLRRERREVAVEQVDERHLQRVGGPHHERGDADVEHRDPAGRRDPVEPVREPLRERLAQDEEPESDRAEQQGERDEERPPRCVIRPPRPGRAEGLGRGRRRDADAERVDARARVTVGGGRAPAHRVRLAPVEPGERRADAAAAGGRHGRARDLVPVGGEHLDRARRDRDRLVEAHHDGGRRLVEARLRRGRDER